MSIQPHTTPDDITNRFGYHRATFPVDYNPKTSDTPLVDHLGEHDEDGNVATAPQHAVVRKAFIDLAIKMTAVVPPGREQSLMLTKLQEAAMWANAGVAMQSPLVKE